MDSPALHRLDPKDIPNAVRLVAPDLGVLVVSAVCLGVCRRFTREARQSQPSQEPVSRGGRNAQVGGRGLLELGSGQLRIAYLFTYFLTNVEFSL